MSIIFQERESDSSYVQTVTHGHTASAGSTIRPAESHWHMVIVKVHGETRLLAVGPWSSAGVASWGEGAEIVWIKFKLGTFMPHLPTSTFANSEVALPGAASNRFWLKGAAWQFPDHEHVETFVARLVHDEILVRDPVVSAALGERLPEIPARTMRHRFLRVTGQTQSHLRQFERAQHAAALLAQGVSILDTVYEAGYFDQPHLTRSLKRFTGRTPAQQFTPVAQSG